MRSPGATLVGRVGWEWIAVRCSVTVIGLDDRQPAIHGERLRVLLRDVFTPPALSTNDLDTDDRVMRDERRVAVLITSARFTTNRR